MPGGPRIWASVDYLRWWITPGNSPELIQAVPGDMATNLGSTLPPGSTTRIFPQDREIKFGAFNGVRGTVGAAGECIGFDFTGFGLEEKTSSASIFSNGLPFAVAQQYTSAGSGRPTSLYASLAGAYEGGAFASTEARVFGYDANIRTPFYRMFADWNHALVGFRYFDLDEDLLVGSDSIFPNGGRLSIRDEIRTRNQFFGGQVGLASRYGGYDEGFGLDSTLKLALGGVRQRADLSGTNTVFSPNGFRDTARGGLYVQPSNAGDHDRTKVAFLTEYNLNLTYNFNPCTQVFFGYSIIWLSSVMRPAETLDPVINDSRIRYVANPPQSDSNAPTYTWRANDFWTQGLNFGVRFQY